MLVERAEPRRVRRRRRARARARRSRRASCRPRARRCGSGVALVDVADAHAHDLDERLPIPAGRRADRRGAATAVRTTVRACRGAARSVADRCTSSHIGSISRWMPCTWYVSLKPSMSVFQLQRVAIDAAAVQRNSSRRAHAQSSGTASRKSASGSASRSRFTKTSGPQVSTATGTSGTSSFCDAELARATALRADARRGPTSSDGTGNAAR